MDKVRAPGWITIAYLLLASVWIWLTQWVLSQIGGGSWAISTAGLVFGEVFVLVTGGLLYPLLRHYAGQRDAPEADESPRVLSRGWTISLISVVILMLIGQVLLSVYAAKAYAPTLSGKAQADAVALASVRADQIDHWLSLQARDVQALNQRHTMLINLLKGLDTSASEALRPLSRLVAPAHFDALTLYDPEHTNKLHLGRPLRDSVPDRLFEQAAATARPRFGARFSPDSAGVDVYWVIPVFLDKTEVSGGPWYVVYHDRLTGKQLDLHARHVASDSAQQWLLHPQLASASGRFRSVLALSVTPAPQSAAADTPQSAPTVDTPTVARIRSLALGGFPAPVGATMSPSGQDVLVTASLAQMLGSDQAASRADGKPLTGSGTFMDQSVIYAMLPVPRLQSWLFVTMDRQSVLAPVSRLEKWLSLAALIGTLAIMSALVLLWRLVRRMHAVRLAAEMNERDRLLMQFYNLPMIGMAVFEPETLESLRINQRLAQIYHSTIDALTGMTFGQLFAGDGDSPTQRSLDAQSIRGLILGHYDELSFERSVTLGDSSPICVQIHVRAVRLPSGFVSALVATVDDVTHDRMVREVLSCQRDLYHMSAQVGAAMISAHSGQHMFEEVCRLAVSGTAFSSVCLFEMRHDGQGQPESLCLSAASDDPFDCLASFDPGSTGQGTVGQDLLDRVQTARQPIYLDDLLGNEASPAMRIWARRHGIVSLAILPLVHEQELLGIMILVSQTSGLWTEEVQRVLTDLAAQMARATVLLLDRETEATESTGATRPRD